MEENKQVKTEGLEPISNPYTMNNYNIIQMVRKNFRVKGKKKWSVDDMRKEYFDIVVKKKLESQEWIDYFRDILKIE
jgi:hypothetical protein